MTRHRASYLTCDAPLTCSPAMPCYDCGSTLPGRHTLLCDFADDEAGDLRDLPAIPGTQWWVNARRG